MPTVRNSKRDKASCSAAYIAEALVYSRDLTIPERVTIEIALEARYGIQP